MLLIPILLLMLILFVVGVWLRRALAAHERRRQVAQLRQWATDHDILEPALQQWIQQLPPNQAQVLWEMLDDHCTSLHWELNWLFAPQIKKAPELKMALEESVSAYARAILHSLQMEADVAAYHAYVAFEQNPNARKQGPLVEQLYQKVNNEGLTPPAKRFFGRFSWKGPSAKAKITAIQQAFERDPAHAMAALKTVLAADAVVTVAHVRQELTSPVVLTPAGTTA